MGGLVLDIFVVYLLRVVVRNGGGEEPLSGRF
jgi:hypothetical protein